jgi:predicted dehydrogenase
MTVPEVNIALIGSGFMGRAHSNGLRQVDTFFDLPVKVVRKVLAARNPQTGGKLASAFGWQEYVQDWRAVLERDDIHVVDIGTPGYTHAEIAIAALQAGKAVICEKPLANTLDEARQMAAAAEKAGVLTMCNFNLRATPAVALARQMIAAGRLGRVHQWRAAFQQGWLVNTDFPLTWRLQKDRAGSGALGDLGSHSIDMARVLVGEVASVNALMHTFTKQRPIPLRDEGRNSKPSGEFGEVTVDDSVWVMLAFENGAYGTMEATRMATGQAVGNRFEVYGDKGGLLFDFMRLNELQYFDATQVAEEQGWRTIHVTGPMHPYLEGWWPKGHSLGYEHTFAHLFRDFFTAYAEGRPAEPDFADALRTQAVLAAIEDSSAQKQWVDVR